MFNGSEIFEKHYRDYCQQIGKVDFVAIKDKLGVQYDGDQLIVPFYNGRYVVSKDGIADSSGNRPDYMLCVIIAKYILLCPDELHQEAEWVSFKDLRKSSHFLNLNYFTNDTESAIVKHFAGRLDELSKACASLAGSPYQMEISYDLSMQFQALPRISLLLLFNDGDEEFPAKCSVLFQRCAEFYLDPESLAMTGAVLTKRLKSLC